MFGEQELKQPLYHYPTNDERFQNEIQEAKEVLAMFNVPASKFVGLSDIDELRSMMYGIEHQLLDVIEDRKLIKAIFNNAGKSLEEKANELCESGCQLLIHIINKERRRYFEQKYHIIRRREITLACDFLEKLLNEPKLISNNDKKVSNELFHYNLNYNEEQFKSIYTFLIDGKFLESTTALEDFIYYFSGNGAKPYHGLKWIDKKVNLAQFIDTLCNKEKKKWVIAELIFGEDGLRQSNGNTVYRKNDNNPFEDLKNTLKKK